MNFSGVFGRASTIWYPALGYRDCYDGSLSSAGFRGYYWSASPYNYYYAYNLTLCSAGFVYPSSDDDLFRAYGYSVRCLQVIDEVAGANAEESK